MISGSKKYITHPLLCGAKLVLVRDDLRGAWKTLHVEWLDGSYSGAWRELLLFVGLALINAWKPHLELIEYI